MGCGQSVRPVTYHGLVPPNERKWGKRRQCPAETELELADKLQMLRQRVALLEEELAWVPPEFRAPVAILPSAADPRPDSATATLPIGNLLREAEAEAEAGGKEALLTAIEALETRLSQQIVELQQCYQRIKDQARQLSEKQEQILQLSQLLHNANGDSDKPFGPTSKRADGATRSNRATPTRNKATPTRPKQPSAAAANPSGTDNQYYHNN